TVSKFYLGHNLFDKRKAALESSSRSRFVYSLKPPQMQQYAFAAVCFYNNAATTEQRCPA
ncbi:MAG: hypothetical protein KIC46_08570, partial [Clostridiales bacterium]|nr:hypothetical protein [Clostridiales bacterium]